MASEIQTLLISRLGRIAAEHNLTLAIAESCTGGALCSAIVAHPKASGALERGFIVYSTDAKCELLGLDRGRVEECAGVSADIAKAMASAAIAQSRADLGIAITGFAGPRQGSEEVGLVHLAVARNRRSWHRELHLGAIGREAVCRNAVREALELALLAARAPESLEAPTSSIPPDNAKSVSTAELTVVRSSCV